MLGSQTTNRSEKTKLANGYFCSPMLDQIILCSNKLIRILAHDTGKQIAVLEMDKKEWKTKTKPTINRFTVNKNGTD